MSHRTAGLNHQAGSLLPKLRGVLATLARHADILPAGPAVPPVRCPPSGVNPKGDRLWYLLLLTDGWLPEDWEAAAFGQSIHPVLNRGLHLVVDLVDVRGVVGA